MLELYAAGETASNVTFDTRTSLVKVINKTATAVTVTFYGDSAGTGPGIAVVIPSVNTGFVDIWGDFQKMTVSGGTIDYIVFV